jgi:hypothetical protein
VEGVHQDVVLGLEHQHVVEGAGDTQGHGITKCSLSYVSIRTRLYLNNH